MDTSKAITDATKLTPGGCWEDEAGREVEAFFDTFLQLAVATDAADAFLPQ